MKASPQAVRLLTSIPEMRSYTREVLAQGQPFGLVPTMGALHEGHLSLVRRAAAECDAVVVSIFVNPTQFGPGEDLARYPRNLERDLDLLLASIAGGPPRALGAFAPSAAEIYPSGFATFVEPGPLAARLEGAARPGHFRGVATIVTKLFNMVVPDAAYFGQKDFQQAVIIRRLVEDLNLGVRLVVCPIVREADGLALSSRNAYLSPEDRSAACVLYRSLQRAQSLVEAGETDAPKVVEEMQKVFTAEPRAKLDYAEIVEAASLQPVERIEPGCVTLVAARMGAARLIDNMILGPAGASEEERLRLAGF